MIRVHKREEAPIELQTHGYGDDEVKKALLKDQREKCYLCERKMTTDYEVEHLVSQNGDESKTNDWDNLFVACNYCNDRKKHLYDDIPQPNSMNFEDIIQQGCDMLSKKASFHTTEQDEKVHKLVSLLERLYNGKNPLRRNLMEERFWNQFVEEYSSFLRRLHAYLKHQSPENYQLIIDDLNLDSTILGFKYNYIKHNAKLYALFRDEMTWNRE